ncbi:integrase [Pandoraea sputorum]|nr:integrase [Pandoraea sputorum]
MMAERGVAVDSSTIHRWVAKSLPVFEKAKRDRLRTISDSPRMAPIYVRTRGQGKYLHGAAYNAGARRRPAPLTKAV